MKPRSANAWLFVGALLGGLAVAAGAFGAHALRGHFAADGLLSQGDERQLANWETAARYQMYHALALLVTGLLIQRRPTAAVQVAGLAFTTGTIIFSGSLYALVLSGQRWLGAVTPIGGVLLLVGWICLAGCLAHCWRTHAEP